MTSPPILAALEWHARQFFCKMGATCLLKSGEESAWTKVADPVTHHKSTISMKLGPNTVMPIHEFFVYLRMRSLFCLGAFVVKFLSLSISTGIEISFPIS